MSSDNVRKVKCPYCGKDAVFAATNPYRPFCSERCKTIDLGAWADESYRVPAQNSSSYQDEGFLDEEDHSENE